MLCWLHSDNTQNDVAQPDSVRCWETNSSSGRGHFQPLGFLYFCVIKFVSVAPSYSGKWVPNQDAIFQWTNSWAIGWTEVYILQSQTGSYKRKTLRIFFSESFWGLILGGCNKKLLPKANQFTCFICFASPEWIFVNVHQSTRVPWSDENNDENR